MAEPNYTRMQEAFNRYRNNPALHMDGMEEEAFKIFGNLHEALKADPNDPRWDEVCQEKSAPESAEGDTEC